MELFCIERSTLSYQRVLLSDLQHHSDGAGVEIGSEDRSPQLLILRPGSFEFLLEATQSLFPIGDELLNPSHDPIFGQPCFL